MKCLKSGFLFAGLILAGTTVAVAQDSGTKSGQKLREQPLQASSARDAAKDSKTQAAWKDLLPKSGLKHWEVTDFGAENQVKNEDGILTIDMGDPLNGINYVGKDFPKDRFEIELECQRVEGSDFFCGLTFPIGKGHCSLIVGGWGGNIVGLSSVDGADASENDTTTYAEFKNGKWYKVRLRVDDEQVRVWIDEEEYFRQEREGRDFETRIEVFASQPLGLCAFQSKVQVRNMRWRKLGK